METAKIIGYQQLPKDKDSSKEENPHIYSEVLSHVTSILRPNVQETTTIKSMNNDKKDEVTSNEQIDDILSSKYEKPRIVRKETEPSFLEKSLNKNNKNKDFVIAERTPDQEIQDDLSYFTSILSNAKTPTDKLKFVMNGRERLIREYYQLRDEIEKDLIQLIESKKAAIKVNKIIKSYEKYLITAQEEKRLRLGDEIGVKQLLKEKLKKEVQGIRSSPYQFKLLEEIEPSQIENVTKQVFQKLRINK